MINRLRGRDVEAIMVLMENKNDFFFFFFFRMWILNDEVEEIINHIYIEARSDLDG